MRKKISVIGAQGVEIAHTLAAYTEVTEDVSGADVVVLAGEDRLDEIRERAPAATVIVAGDRLEERCRLVYEATLFPRARIFGAAGDAAPAAAESVVFERDEEHEVVAMIHDEFAPRRARLGRGGIRELL